MSSSQFVLIGNPVEHSVSPAMFRAAFAALGMAHRYELLPCPDETSVERAVAELRAGNLAGANVTLPWKRLALQLADASDARSRAAGACNVLARRDQGVHAFNSDAMALDEELARLHPKAKTVVVIGSGGVARAVVATARSRGATQIVVTSRRPSAAAELSGPHTIALPWPTEDSTDWSDVWARADVVVQATSATLGPTGSGEAIADLVPWQRLPANALAYDVCYVPVVTPFLAAAKEHGVRNEGGLEMLVLQAANAFEVWLGMRPPMDVMRRAAESALGGEG
jgi:shikimate dehydrogenase